MSAPHDPRNAEAEVFRSFGLARRAERDRLSLADMAELDRRFENGAIDRISDATAPARAAAIAPSVR